MSKEVMGVSVSIGHSSREQYGNATTDDSPLMEALRSANGEPVNECPFGCEDEDLDEQGFCYHLIGVSPDGKKLERNIVGLDGRVRTICPVKKINGRNRFVPETIDREKLKRKKIILKRITTSFRVYEDIERPDNWEPAVSDELDDELPDDLEETDDDDEGDESNTEPETLPGEGE